MVRAGSACAARPAPTGSTATAAATASSVSGAEEELTGGTGEDRIFGGSGDDVSDGQNGNDHLAGGRGEDAQSGGTGNGTFRTRDGEVDRITCGAGTDKALLDRVDVITDATAENPASETAREAKSRRLRASRRRVTMRA